ncbi:hypothetical protein [Aquella oligotrophica]|uniref:Uncharacterized protein n=1 Tax=Aquella oligotrophica TaxID=2067065 RepID=A0A2I7N985_9NEIS|nr:hypothetical protein [Aquella oligotrophica]AUR52805.1 hypothetical protein CUN60_11040 [Aquella oligotrophica]
MKLKIITNTLCLLLLAQTSNAAAGAFEGKHIKPCVEVNTNQITDTKIEFTFASAKFAWHGASCMYSPAKNNDIKVTVKIPDGQKGKFCGAPVWIVPKNSTSNGDTCWSSHSYFSVKAEGTVNEMQQPSYNFTAMQNLMIDTRLLERFTNASTSGKWINTIDGVSGEFTSTSTDQIPFTQGMGVGEFTVELKKQ